MESKLIKIKTDGDILRDAYVISGFDIDGSEYVVYYIDRDDGENDNLFVSKLIKNNDGTYNLLNIENANEKINVSNIVKQIVKHAIDDSEHDTLEGDSVTLGAKLIKLCPVIINREQSIDIQKTYITTVKKSVTSVTKKYYDVKLNVAPAAIQEDIFPEQASADIFASTVPVQQPEAGSVVANVTGADTVVQNQTVPSVVEPVLPVLDPVAPTPIVVAEAPAQTTPVVSMPEVPVSTVAAPEVPPVVNVQNNTAVLDIPVGMIDAAPAVQSQPVVAPTPVVVAPTPVQTPPVAPISEVPAATVAAPVVPSFVETSPIAQQSEPAKVVLDASKESNLNSALGEISKEAIPVANIEAVKEFGVDDAVSPEIVNTTVAPAADTPEQAAVSKKAGFANSKFFMFVAVGFFIASCIFMGYEAFSYYQMVK